MISLIDLSPLMQRTIAKGITFMVSKSGIPGKYNLYFAYHTGKSNKSAHLTYHEDEQKIWQYADEENPIIPFHSINDLLVYVSGRLDVPAC